MSLKHYEWKVETDLHVRNVAKYGQLVYIEYYETLWYGWIKMVLNTCNIANRSLVIYGCQNPNLNRTILRFYDPTYPKRIFQESLRLFRIGRIIRFWQSQTIVVSCKLLSLDRRLSWTQMKNNILIVSRFEVLGLFKWCLKMNVGNYIKWMHIFGFYEWMYNLCDYLTYQYVFFLK